MELTIARSLPIVPLARSLAQSSAAVPLNALLTALGRRGYEVIEMLELDGSPACADVDPRLAPFCPSCCTCCCSFARRLCPLLLDDLRRGRPRAPEPLPFVLVFPLPIEEVDVPVGDNGSLELDGDTSMFEPCPGTTYCVCRERMRVVSAAANLALAQERKHCALSPPLAWPVCELRLDAPGMSRAC